MSDGKLLCDPEGNRSGYRCHVNTQLPLTPLIIGGGLLYGELFVERVQRPAIAQEI